MKKKKEGVTVAIWLEVDTVSRLDVLAEYVNMTRSKLAANLIKAGLPEAKFYEKIGLVSVVLWFQNIKERLIGMGTQPKKNGVTVGVWLDNDTVDRIDMLAEHINITRSKLAANLVEAELPEMEFYKNIGAVKALMWFQGIKDKIADKNLKKAKMPE